MASYQCWPDQPGEPRENTRPVFRHVCKDGKSVTSTLPRLANGGWRWDDEDKVTPSVVCTLCGFHEILVKTHDERPE